MILEDADFARLRADSPSLPPALLARLWQFSQGRLAAGDGLAALNLPPAVLLALSPGYSAGFLPPTFAEALRTDERDLLAGHDLAGTLILPAFDESDRVVDFAAWRPGHFASTLFADSRGLLGPRIASAHAADLTVVDTVVALIERLGSGKPGTLLLRNPADAAANASRLNRSGVQRLTLAVTGDTAAFTAALSGAGIAIDAPTTNPGLELVEINRREGRANFRIGDLTLVASIPTGPTRLHLLARRDGKVHQDSGLDLAQDVQRQRFARAAARKLGCDAGTLAQALAALLPRLTAIASGDDTATAPATAASVPAEPAEAACLLAEPDLADRFVADLDALGWAGDIQAKRLGLLTLAGRTLPSPPWLVLRGDRSLTGPAFAALSALVADDHRMVLDRANANGLARTGDLRHKILLTDDGADHKAETYTTLWRLHERGAFAASVPTRAPNGQHRSGLTEIQGPVGLIAAASKSTALEDIAILVHLDDTPEQLARVVGAARNRHRASTNATVGPNIIARWRAVFAVLPASPVAIPFADRVQFPATRPKHRREVEAFFSLIEANARLHHRQRSTHDGAIVATEADFEAAELAARGVLGIAANELPRRCTQVLDALRATAKPSFTTAEVQALLAGWAPSSLYDALNVLVERDLLASAPVGHGRRARVYEIVPGAITVNGHGPTIRLLPSEVTTVRPSIFTDISGKVSGNIGRVG